MTDRLLRDACSKGHPYVDGSSYTIQIGGNGNTYRRCCICHAAKARQWRINQLATRPDEFRANERRRHRRKAA